MGGVASVPTLISRVDAPVGLAPVFCTMAVMVIVSVIVGFLYGGTLLSGVLPRFGSQVSWDGHLFGAIGGGIIAYVLTSERGPHGTSTGKDEVV